MAGMRRFEQRRRNTEKRKRNPFVIIGCEGKNKTEKYILIISIVDNVLLNFLKEIAQTL